MLKFDVTRGLSLELDDREVVITGYDASELIDQLVSSYGVGKILELIDDDEMILECLDREIIEAYRSID
jgi:hypothetical protein